MLKITISPSFVNGSGNAYGGAIYANINPIQQGQNRTTLSINDNNFRNSFANSSSNNYNGGAIYITTATYSGGPIYTNNTFINSSSKMGEIFMPVYDSLIKDNVFTDSTASNQRGSIFSGTNNTISENEFTIGSAVTGGSIYINSKIRIKCLTIVLQITKL